jgi:hypothetical protein
LTKKKTVVPTGCILSLQKNVSAIVFSLNVNTTYKDILLKLSLEDIYIKSNVPIVLNGNIRQQLLIELKKNINNNTKYLFLELINDDFLSRDLEEIFSCLINILEEQKQIRLVSIATSSRNQIIEAIYFNEIKKYCGNHNIGLLLLDTEKRDIVSVDIVRKGEYLSSSRKITINKYTNTEVSKKIKVLRNEEIINKFQKVYDHFEISINNMIYHTPVIGSVKKLSLHQGFLNRLYQDITSVIKDRFLIKTFGIESGGINNLALTISNFGEHKIVNEFENAYNYSSLVILCDFIAPYYSINEFIINIAKRGVDNVLIIGIEKFKNFNLSVNGVRVNLISYHESNYFAYSSNELKSCAFCKHGDISPITGSTFDDFVEKIGEYNSIKFWEFLNQNECYFESKHWISPTTSYHYLFRPISKIIFYENLYNITKRFYNILREKKFDELSIAKILCPDEYSSKLLSEGLGEFWNLEKDDVIPIPRKYLRPIAGTDIPVRLINYLKNNNLRIYPKQNVVIVDQAAHNTKTVTSLNRISKYFKGNTVGILVFIDRTREEIKLQYDSNTTCFYFSLYRWSIQPLEAIHCPCEKE